MSDESNGHLQRQAAVVDLHTRGGVRVDHPSGQPACEKASALVPPDPMASGHAADAGPQVEAPAASQGDPPALPPPEPVRQIVAKCTSAQLRALMHIVAQTVEHPSARTFDSSAAMGLEEWRAERLHLDVRHGTLRLCAYRGGTFSAIWLGFEPLYAALSISVVLPPVQVQWCGLASVLQQRWPESGSTCWSVIVALGERDSKPVTVSLLCGEDMRSFWSYDPIANRLALPALAREHALGLSSAHLPKMKAAALLQAACSEFGLQNAQGHVHCKTQSLGNSPGAVTEFTVSRIRQVPSNAASVRAAGTKALLSSEPPLMQGWTIDAAVASHFVVQDD